MTMEPAGIVVIGDCEYPCYPLAPTLLDRFESDDPRWVEFSEHVRSGAARAVVEKYAPKHLACLLGNGVLALSPEAIDDQNQISRVLMAEGVYWPRGFVPIRKPKADTADGK